MKLTRRGFIGTILGAITASFTSFKTDLGLPFKNVSLAYHGCPTISNMEPSNTIYFLHSTGPMKINTAGINAIWMQTTLQ